jgi:putative DNA primase/helicase
MLAFWTGSDAERVDRLFRRSGLMRQKWDRPTGTSKYSELTIRAAFASMGKFSLISGASSKSAIKNV